MKWSASRSSHYTRREKSPWYPLDRRLGGPHIRSGRGGEEKRFHHCPCCESNPSHPAHSLVTILTELLWLLHKCNYNNYIVVIVYHGTCQEELTKYFSVKPDRCSERSWFKSQKCYRSLRSVFVEYNFQDGTFRYQTSYPVPCNSFCAVRSAPLNDMTVTGRSRRCYTNIRVLIPIPHCQCVFLAVRYAASEELHHLL
jgi:hypothetical protein